MQSGTLFNGLRGKTGVREDFLMVRKREEVRVNEKITFHRCYSFFCLNTING
jgi:hypothetical protein